MFDNIDTEINNMAAALTSCVLLTKISEIIEEAIEDTEPSDIPYLLDKIYEGIKIGIQKAKI